MLKKEGFYANNAHCNASLKKKIWIVSLFLLFWSSYQLRSWLVWSFCSKNACTVYETRLQESGHVLHVYFADVNKGIWESWWYIQSLLNEWLPTCGFALECSCRTQLFQFCYPCLAVHSHHVVSHNMHINIYLLHSISSYRWIYV